MKKLSIMATSNIKRLTMQPPSMSGWDLLMQELIQAATWTKVAPKVRLRAAEIVVEIVSKAAEHSYGLDDEMRMPLQRRLFETFWQTIVPLLADDRRASVTTVSMDVDVHHTILEALKSLLEHCGEHLQDGWDVAFQIIGSIFVPVRDSKSVSTRSPRLVRSAFGSLELICSDFLASLPRSECFLTLIDTLYQFCSQEDDLNICLTVCTTPLVRERQANRCRLLHSSGLSRITCLREATRYRLLTG